MGSINCLIHVDKIQSVPIYCSQNKIYGNDYRYLLNRRHLVIDIVNVVKKLEKLLTNVRDKMMAEGFIF